MTEAQETFHPVGLEDEENPSEVLPETEEMVSTEFTYTCIESDVHSLSVQVSSKVSLPVRRFPYRCMISKVAQFLMVSALYFIGIAFSLLELCNLYKLEEGNWKATQHMRPRKV